MLSNLLVVSDISNFRVAILARELIRSLRSRTFAKTKRCGHFMLESPGHDDNHNHNHNHEPPILPLFLLKMAPPLIEPFLKGDTSRNTRGLLRLIILCTIAAAAVSSRLFSVISKSTQAYSFIIQFIPHHAGSSSKFGADHLA